ncbi:MalY/PatB family protein [Trichococcus pasteurii]|uniref:cysteine-S-conjugate beta-lyase n=1 Tax=Trichococcus pasteurii TaxID=43064 RepID=A0A1W1IIK8_9LACT|nr:aminotransferase class I/II-fold pyridoxal phosphate-dependent enzyme [Trichococcus pasteurii]SFE77548.1 cystathione beta-lyase [Trichococcus pasteurii]SLM52878.1 aminotransferase class i/classii [Trichococcus pasteurii]SSB93759.1 aminotransferase class i/classii [Trichococcus pasteurii]
MRTFDNPLNRRGNGSKKWDKDYIQRRFRTAREDVYPLFIADMDFRQDAAVLQAFHAFVETGDFGYFDVPDSFYDTIQAWYRDKLKTPIEKEWLVPANGTIASMHFAADLVSKGQPIMMLTPVYGVFKDIATNFGGMVTVPLLEADDAYRIDTKRMEQEIVSQSVGTLLFCNPHNPSGRIWSYEELQEVVRICKEHGVIILSDEIHGELNLTEKPFISLISFMDEYEDIIVASSPNKTFNLSGLTASYVIIRNPELRQAYQHELARFHITINRAGMAFISAAYEHGGDWHNDLIAYLKGNMALMEEQLAGLDLEWMQPDSGFLVWIRLNKVTDVDRFVLELAQQTGVLVETGSRFVADYGNHIRLNCATSRGFLGEALDKFRDFYQHYTN